jgi:hypothetical protein
LFANIFITNELSGESTEVEESRKKVERKKKTQKIPNTTTIIKRNI